MKDNVLQLVRSLESDEEGVPANHHVVEDDAEREEVRPWINQRLLTLPLLRREVSEIPTLGFAGLRQVGQ